MFLNLLDYKEHTLFDCMIMELFEIDVEIYNSKMRLLNWLYDEIRLHSEFSKDLINEKGQKLPLNI